MQTHLVVLASGMTLLLSNVSYSLERAPPIFRVLEISNGSNPVLPVFPTGINDLGSMTGLPFHQRGSKFRSCGATAGSLKLPAMRSSGRRKLSASTSGVRLWVSAIGSTRRAWIP
jgi:hypothetical protein